MALPRDNQLENSIFAAGLLPDRTAPGEMTTMVNSAVLQDAHAAVRMEALLVLSEGGDHAVPDRAALEGALALAQGAGSAAISEQVMFGSAAREAINDTAGIVRKAGGTTVTSRQLAIGAIVSGNVSPMFYSSLGVSKDELRTALEGAAAST